MADDIVCEELEALLRQRCSRRKLFLSLLAASPARRFLIRGAATPSAMTNFEPERHGLHFRNSFVNVILNLPGFYLTTRGRCGGMAYTALDYYFSHLPVPPYEHVPECEQDSTSPVVADAQAYNLVHYIFARQLHSMISVRPFGRADDFLWYTIASDQEVFYGTVNRELESLKQWMRLGIPVPLGLIGVSDAMRIGENHQVVACGYSTKSTASAITAVYIYDPNHPGQRVTLFIDSMRQRLLSSTGRTWRGFFVRDDYWPQRPSRVEPLLHRPYIA